MNQLARRESSLSPPPPVLQEQDEPESEAISDVDELNSLDSYDLERAENIKNNVKLLESLGLNAVMPIRPQEANHHIDKKPRLSSEEYRARKEAKIRNAARRAVVEPTRRSGRVADRQRQEKDRTNHQSLRDSTPPRTTQIIYNPIPKQRAPILQPGPEYDGSTELPSAPLPSKKDDGTLVFEGRWKGVFTPNITPEEMYKGGAFGGAYFCDTYSTISKTNLKSSEDIKELPFTPSPSFIKTHLTRSQPDPNVNRFGVRAGQSLQEWEKAGWIYAPDPRGWAQWYLRFYNGRRSVDDERQVKRWLKCAGPTGRFKNSLIKKIALSGGEGVLGDEDIGRIVRQTLWQWGYELTLSEYRKVMGKK